MIKKCISLLFAVMLLLGFGCSTTEPIDEPIMNVSPVIEDTKVEGVDYFLSHIDLNNWKVTLPVGSPSEVEPPEILNYASIQNLQEFMYNDSTDGSLVFYTYPGSTTANSSYSRTELREQMVPGSNSTNWKFGDGAIMEGELAVTDISQGDDGKDHRVIIMQIHGRLSNEQRDMIGENDNNAPPVLKIYWDKGKIRVKTKILKDQEVSDVDILKTASWGDDDGYNFETVVNHDRFSLKVDVSYGQFSVTLNQNETKVYKSEDLEKWDVFENYFKAGNYLQSKDPESYAKVKYYSLEISHP